jgi:hypothetical protein
MSDDPGPELDLILCRAPTADSVLEVLKNAKNKTSAPQLRSATMFCGLR